MRINHPWGHRAPTLLLFLFVTVLPAHASPITVELDGTAAKDSYVQSGSPNTNFGSLASAQVKRDNDTNFTRKAYLGFDLSSLPAGDIVGVELLVDFVDSTAGQTDSTTPWAFELFGLTNESLDGWIESGPGSITWNNAPANNTNVDNNPQVNNADAQSLATFPRIGKGEGQVVINDPNLLTFLLNDLNSLVTFILVRNTNAPVGENYVHAIATRENASEALWPMLRVTLEPRAIPLPGTALLLILGLAGLALKREVFAKREA